MSIKICRKRYKYKCEWPASGAWGGGRTWRARIGGRGKNNGKHVPIHILFVML